jgi:protein O-mannosyl-transferase
MNHQDHREFDECAAAAPAVPPSRTDGTADFWPSGRNRDWLPAWLLIAATFLAYQPVWSAGFIWDDDLLLTGNPFITGLGGLRGIWFSTALPDYFPMTSTLLWLQWRLWGSHPLGYHLVNVLFHSLSAILWWRVLARLNIRGAWLAAAIFALHPVNVESVAWISEIKNTLAMVFYVSTVLAYLRFEDTGQRRWYGVAMGAFGLSLLSKTAAAPWPLLLLGLAWWRRGRVVRQDLWRSIPFFAVAALLALVTVWFQYHRAIGATVVRTDDFWSRLATAGWAIWFYLSQALLPVNLSFIYPRWQVDASAALAGAPALLFAAGLLVCWFYRRTWGKAWLLGLGCFGVMLLPVLGFLNISFMRYSLVADRWQYFAIIGPIALVAAGITRFASGRRRTRAASGQGGGAGAVLRNGFLQPALCGALLLVLGVLTWRQCLTFRSPETLWRATIAANPDCALAHANLGNVLVQKGQADEAVIEYRRALKTGPDSESAHYNYGYFLLQRGQVDEAILRFQKALAIQPGLVPARYHLGNALVEQGRLEEAMTHYQKALELAPDLAEIQNRLGDVLLRSGQVDEAMAHFQKAVQIQPHYAKALNNLGIALFHQGKKTGALECFRQALEIEPDLVEAHVNLGKTLLQAGQAQEAVMQYRIALRLQPDDPATLSDLAWLLATWPETPIRSGTEALELARRADRIAGGQDPLILRVLAAAHAANGQFNSAADVARRAARLAGPEGALPEKLQGEIKLYETGVPVRDGVKSE